MKHIRFLPLLMILSGSSFSQKNAALFPACHTGPLTNPQEVPVIGNGDLGAWVQVLSQELGIHLGKNDVWDARQTTVTKDVLVTQDEIIAHYLPSGHFEKGSFRVSVPDNYSGLKVPLRDIGSIRHSSSTSPPPGESGGINVPKRVGSVRMVHAGDSRTVVTSKLDISRGLLTVNYKFELGMLVFESFIHRSKNSVLVKVSAQGTVPRFRFILEKNPDYADGSIPYPQVSASGGKQIVSQTIPAGCGVDAFSWHLAGSFPGESEAKKIPPVQKMAYGLQQDITLTDGQSIVFQVGIATDRDGDGNSKSRAISLAGPASPVAFDKELASHTEHWDKFWSASGIVLEDKALEAAWYRDMYLLAIHIKPGAQAPGINANIAIEDYPVFNGSYVWNHNTQKYFLASFPVNHPEWYEVFADLVEMHIPHWEYLAKEKFNFDGAVFVSWGSAPFIPVERAQVFAYFRRALSLSGWVSQLLYSHYEFTQDKDWLRKRAYPYIKRCAEFYASYLEKYQNADGDIFPSARLEDNHILEGFVDNTNVVTDLVMFKKGFEGAIAASKIIGVDADLRSRWEQALLKVPAIEYGKTEGKSWYAVSRGWKEIWPDIDDYLNHLRYSRWGVNGWLVYPGEYLDGDEEGGLAQAVRDVMTGLDIHNLPVDRSICGDCKIDNIGIMHGEGTISPYIRLGMTEFFPDIRKMVINHRVPSGLMNSFSLGSGQYLWSGNWTSWRVHENAYFGALMIPEMLLQSQSAILRFFPFWDRTQTAAFRDLRARGGFLVSGSFDPSSGIKASITSLAGNTCRIRWRESIPPVISQAGKAVTITKQDRDLVFETKAGMTYQVNGGIVNVTGKDTGTGTGTATGTGTGRSKSLKLAQDPGITATAPSLQTDRGATNITSDQDPGIAAIPPSLQIDNGEPDFTSGQHTGNLTNPYQGMVVSNGQLHINAQVFSHELVLNMGLNGTWGKFHVVHPGDSRMEILSQCNPTQGTISVEYGFFKGGKLIINVVLDNENHAEISAAAEGKIPWINLILEKQPDYLDPDMPRPDVSEGSITQAIPGKPDWRISSGLSGGLKEGSFDIQKDNIFLDSGGQITVSVSLSGG